MDGRCCVETQLEQPLQREQRREEKSKRLSTTTSSRSSNDIQRRLDTRETPPSPVSTRHAAGAWLRVGAHRSGDRRGQLRSTYTRMRSLHHSVSVPLLPPRAFAGSVLPAAPPEQRVSRRTRDHSRRPGARIDDREGRRMRGHPRDQCAGSGGKWENQRAPSAVMSSARPHALRTDTRQQKGTTADRYRVGLRGYQVFIFLSVDSARVCSFPFRLRASSRRFRLQRRRSAALRALP